MRGVQTCVCFAAPAEMLGEVVGVAVVPVPGGPPPTLPELQAALTLALALSLSLALALALSLARSLSLTRRGGRVCAARRGRREHGGG